MPQDDSDKHYGRAYRHFCPLFIGTTFKREVPLLDCRPLLISRVFTPKHVSTAPNGERSARTARISSPSLVSPPIAESSTSTNHLIPKPPGEVGRINRGGYNLQRAAGFHKEDYEAIRVSRNLKQILN